jgi:SAM-dependent methyltransferase
MWADSRGALTDLELATREWVIDVGCGTGELTRVLREEVPGTVVGLDADPTLLEGVAPPTVVGDAMTLPVRSTAFDLVVCQALLVNLPDPVAALAEFARASRDLVAVVEPDNAQVTVDSTVDAESRLARRARSFYLDGLATDATLGSDTAGLFEEAGISVVSTRRYDHTRATEPPYSEEALESARRKATGEGLDDDRTEIRAGADVPGDYDALRSEWRTMGREVIDQMAAGEYERHETIPFFVTVGRV